VTSHDDALPVTIAPSDLTFLLFGCYRCFYDKVRNGVRQPVSIPRVFTTMDRQQRAFFDGQRTSALRVQLPPGSISCADSPVRSAGIEIRKGRLAITFRGAIDALLKFDDGTYGVVDFKTTHPGDAHVGQYAVQLHSYARALERAAIHDQAVAPVTTLGLLCFEPAGLASDDDGLAYRTNPSWIEFERDDVGFAAILDIIGAVFELDAAPDAPRRCVWCRYRGVTQPVAS
jgi:hypothetical protein